MLPGFAVCSEGASTLKRRPPTSMAIERRGPRKIVSMTLPRQTTCCARCGVRRAMRTSSGRIMTSTALRRESLAARQVPSQPSPRTANAISAVGLRRALDTLASSRLGEPKKAATARLSGRW